MTERKLKDGVVGKELVRYFTDYAGTDSGEPVSAEMLEMDADNNQVQYRITFEDGSVSDWLVTFERSMTEDIIVSAEMFNEVIGATEPQEDEAEHVKPYGRIQEENEYRFGEGYDD